MRIASAGEAVRAIVDAVPVQPSLRIPLADTVGHVLAEDVTAAIALPPWTNAAMDGYAVRADDVVGATSASPRNLTVVDVIAAGTAADRALQRGEAMRIFTGARVPDGADTVIRQEDTDRGAGTVRIHDDRDAGANVRAAGGALALGAVALAAGTVIGPHQLAVLAALGEANPVVHRRPRVGILPTGDEIVSLDRSEEIRAGRRLADVNGPVIAALVQQAGGIAVPLGIARDDVDDLLQLVEAADDVDLLITAGGVSVGDHDHVRTVMSACRVVTSFDRVRVRPGGPTVFGMLPGGGAWLGLPGNPVSAMVTFELFGRAAIRAMAGDRAPIRAPFPVRLRESARRDATLDQYLRCRLIPAAGGGPPSAEITGPQGSGMLMSMVRADALAIVPAGEGSVAADSMVDALLLDPGGRMTTP